MPERAGRQASELGDDQTWMPFCQRSGGEPESFEGMRPIPEDDHVCGGDEFGESFCACIQHGRAFAMTGVQMLPFGLSKRGRIDAQDVGAEQRECPRADRPAMTRVRSRTRTPSTEPHAVPASVAVRSPIRRISTTARKESATRSGSTRSGSTSGVRAARQTARTLAIARAPTLSREGSGVGVIIVDLPCREVRPPPGERDTPGGWAGFAEGADHT